jgi:hypothetical protein
LLGSALLGTVFALYHGIWGSLGDEWSFRFPLTGFGLALLFMTLVPVLIYAQVKTFARFKKNTDSSVVGQPRRVSPES